MRNIVFGVLALVFGGSAQAADWKLVSTSTDGDKTFLDVSSVSRNDNLRITWEKAVDAKVDKDGGLYSVGHWRYDCAARTYSLLSWVRYRADQTILRSHQLPSYEQETRDVVPDTTGETLLNLVCS